MTPESLIVISWIILLLPLLGFVIIIFNQKRLGDKASSIIGTSILGIDLLLSIIVAYTKLVTYKDVALIQTKFKWFEIAQNKAIIVGVGIDNLAAIMLIVVTLISFLVHLFSIDYMHDDKRFPRFFAYLGIFTFSMLGIVLANNFVFMYVFWELVGLSSYLLIGFWYEKDSAANAGKKAFLTNRIGDLGFFIGIMIVFSTYGTFMFDEIFYGAQAQEYLGKIITLGYNAVPGEGIAQFHLPYDSGAWLTAAGILLFCGAIGKSAQFPLHVWLPDAMEGPTPVSALIHAATMVAAGVYLTARLFPMLTADALLFVAYIGAITAFIAATIAISQNDFKKVLAYSTVSQLGYMVMAIGVGAFTTGFMHLVTHAWFKACLFLASGSVIHAMHVSMHHAHDHSMDAQDIRNMGGMRKTMPLTYMMFLIATLAISGVPFTSGFMSKDGILAGTLAFANLSGHWLIPLAGFGAAGITAFYMFRLTIQAFHGKPKTAIAEKTHENRWVITLPLVVLVVLSAWIFYSVNPFNASSGWFFKSIKPPRTAVQDTTMQWKHLINYDVLEQIRAGELHAQSHQGASDLLADASTSIHHHKENKEAHHEDEHHGEGHVDSHGEGHVDSHGEGHGGHHSANEFEHEVHEAHMPAMILSLLIAGTGIVLAFFVYQFRILSSDKLARQMGPLYYGSLNKWYFDEIYDATAIGGTIWSSKIMAIFDNRIIDGLVNLVAAIGRFIAIIVGHFDNIVVDGIVNLSANITGFFGRLIRGVQTGRVQTYIILMIIGAIAIIYFLF